MPERTPPVRDYADALRDFRLSEAEALLSGSLREGLNACVECCDRHAEGGRVALHWESESGAREEVSFTELKERTAQFAGFLTGIGIKPGEVVAGMLPRTPELLTVILGTWRAGAVYQPLFTAFGPKAIEHRVKMSGARLVVTDPANRPKLDAIEDRSFRIMIARGENAGAGDFDMRTELVRQPKSFAPVLRRGDDLFLMMSTSGSTGLAKGVPVPLRALPAFGIYMRDAIGLRPEDRFWNFADPGWAYGLYYAVTGPLLLGCATTFYDGPFSVESTYRIIKTHGITNLAGAPTAYRLLIAAGPQAAAPVKGQLRVVSSAGEPLNPEVVRWFAEHLQAPIHDHYGQTEIGMVACNHHGLKHAMRPGAAGLPTPGYRLAVLNEAGEELGPGEPGVLSVDIAHSPLYWFTGYHQQQTPAIGGGYYRTGDVMAMEVGGTVAFVGRADDVITSAGYRIGPFDVESALIEHPAVIEAAVIGKPDPQRTEIVKAFVVLAAGAQPSPMLAEELRNHVRARLSAHAYPREIEFVESLPKTPSGKVQRFILRNREIEKARAASENGRTMAN